MVHRKDPLDSRQHPEMAAASNLVLLFVATSGQNAELLGSDEEQIVLFVYSLFDVTNGKVVAVQSHYVRPQTEDIAEFALSEECHLQTGLSEEAIKQGFPLEHVLDEFDRFLSSKEIHPEHGGRPFCLCMDGSLHMRMCLHPETLRKNITLPSYFYKYFDIRKEFKKLYKIPSVNCLKDMTDHLAVDDTFSCEYGVKHCEQMVKIIKRLLSDGHEFREPEEVKDNLEPGICTKADTVDDETVVRARGLPWQSSDQDIAHFFKGLNVAKGGVALCLSQQGRRNGEALIRFESKEHRDLALRRHKHHLGQRYIEVYPASGKDFVNVAGGNNTEAQTFLSRRSDYGGQVIVRMRGLPYSAQPEDVLQFFRSGDCSVEVLDAQDGILFVHQSDGRATGDAFVLFASEEEAGRALSKHRECIGSRYIELFKSTTAEVQQVLNRSMDPRTPTETIDPQLPPLIPHLPSTPLLIPQHYIASGVHKDCIRLRGLPFEASVQDILTFLGDLSRSIVYQGVHMVYNAQGTPSGEAFIQMDAEYSAEMAASSKHKKFMFVNNKKRYIEVIQCSGEDMNLFLNNGISPAALMQPSPTLLQPRQTIFSSALSGVTTMLPSPMAALTSNPALVSGGAYPPAMYPYHAATQIPQQLMAPTALQPPVTMTMAMQPRPAQPYVGGPYQPILYWYPSPPVSPQATSYFMPSYPTTVVVKNLSLTVQPAEVLAFLDGIYEVTPDIQIQRATDGRQANDAYVTFSTRGEAERAVTERNRKPLGNRYIEMYMA